MAGINKPIVGVAAAVIVISAGAIYYFRVRSAPLPEAATPAAVEAPAPDAEPAIEHPLPTNSEGPAAAAALPDLKDSDVSLRDALARLVGADGVSSFLRPDDLVRNMVVTIDNLPRQKVAVQKRPTTALSGTFQVNGDELHATLDPQNYDRYKPMVALIGKLDMQKLAQVYIHFYPLFQQSYQNLGYPNGYFNDRLVQVIDVLLATPEPATPIELSRPNVMYTFADPTLEAKPAGQKLLMRMGPENAATIKTKLMELRAIITAAPLKQ
jgi:hypothetical protein